MPSSPQFVIPYLPYNFTAMDRKLNIAIPLIIFSFITAMLPELPGLEYDIRNCWEAWALHIHHNGLRNAYGSTTDYMPIYQYILWGYSKIMGSDAAISSHLYYVRCVILLFDFWGLWYVYKWMDKKLAYFVVATIGILNISYVYDTIIWGQIDGGLATLIFIAVYYAWKKNNILSGLFILLAFNYKIQTIIILPVWGMLFLDNALSSKSWKAIVAPLMVMAAAQLALLIPFMMGQYGVGHIVYLIVHSFSKYEAISIKAPNIWHWLAKGNLLYATDTRPWIGNITYKQAGLAMFFMAALLALLPMLLILYKRWRKPGSATFSREMVWISGALVYLVFYFFNTEIHERYCHPAFIFLTAYAMYTGRYFVYILFSITYFLTLECSMQHLKLSNYEVLIFDMRFLACLHAITMIYLGRALYKEYIINSGSGNSDIII